MMMARKHLVLVQVDNNRFRINHINRLAPTVFFQRPRRSHPNLFQGVAMYTNTHLIGGYLFLVTFTFVISRSRGPITNLSLPL